MNPSDAQSHTAGPSASRGLVFIVDDWPILAELADTLLTADGYETRKFDNPLEALRVIREEGLRPDVLLTDGVMGPMNGLELISACRELVPGIRTILVSGTFDETFVDHQPVKPDRFIGKPYESSHLLNVVHDVLHSP